LQVKHQIAVFYFTLPRYLVQLLMNLLGVTALSIDVPAGEVNCGHTPDLPSFASPF